MSDSTNSNLTFSNPNPNPKPKAAASCRACGTHITFKKLENGKSIAIQDDSGQHRCREWWTWRADDD